jgi:pimeloyl-ACP methyl ester carboxylesterase
MNRRSFTAAVALAAGQIGLAWRRWARGGDAAGDESSTGPFNPIGPTLGGRQFWADEFFFHDWHIQRNVFTGHYRLLDGNNLRRAWGTFAECGAKLEQFKRQKRMPPMQGPGVVVLHGLFRSASSMAPLSRYLHEEGGYTVFNVNYPTTRGTLADHAQSLDKVLQSLEGIDEVHFVGHSLGNLVVRHYLGDHTRPEIGMVPDPRVKRIVMLGPPNRGAQMAEMFAENRLFHFVAGQSASQLAREWEALEARLATPTCEFGILAGGRGGSKGYNPLLGQDNDMVLSVESTRLAGASDFAVLPVLHSLMMDDPRVQQYTLRYLRHGYFVSDDERQPIGPDAPSRAT